MHRPRVQYVTPKPELLRPPAQPLLASAAPVAQNAGSSPARLIIIFGVLLAFVGVGVSLVPASAVPLSMRIRLEQSRQSVLLVCIAVGVACTLAGLLAALTGR